MAERRMLHRKASVSIDLTELRAKHGGDALAFWLLMIPHMDRWGCVPDDPATLRAMVCPTWYDVTAADVKRWVAWMVKRGLLIRISGPDGAKGLHSPEFHSHQRGTQFERESPSRFEPPDITKRWIRAGKRTEVADLQASLGLGADQSQTSLGLVADQSVRKEGKKVLKPSSPSPSPSPIPAPPASAAAEPEPSPGAQAQPPDRSGVNGRGRSGGLSPAHQLIERGLALASARTASPGRDSA